MTNTSYLPKINLVIQQATSQCKLFLNLHCSIVSKVFFFGFTSNRGWSPRPADSEDILILLSLIQLFYQPILRLSSRKRC